MSKFNTKLPDKNKPNVVNRAGGNAFSQTDELALASLLLTSFFSNADTYYETDASRRARLEELLAKVTPEFAAKAAIYARNVFGMRTASHVVAKFLASVPSGMFPKQRFFEKVVYRVDDATEIAAAILAEKDAKLPAAVKRAFANVLTKFDEYQLAKYRGEGKAVNIFDLINLVHPKETPAIKNVITGKFTAPDTFEVKLTQAGQNINKEGTTEEEQAEQLSENKKEAWKELISSRKLGYMALLKNLRNIAEQADEDTIKAACEMLTDEKLIRKSKVFPFRYLVALQATPKVKNRIRTAIMKAMDISVQNIPELSGKTLIAVDTSGSMGQNLPRGDKSFPISVEEVAKVFAAAILKRNPDAEVVAFSSDAAYLLLNSLDPVATLVDKMVYNHGGTNFNAIFKILNKSYDRIIILSDMQGWIGDGVYGYDGWQRGGAPVNSFKTYKSKYNANPFIYSIDLVGYGDMMFPEDKVVKIAGFSDKILDFFTKFEEGIGGVVEEIRKVEI